MIIDGMDELKRIFNDEDIKKDLLAHKRVRDVLDSRIKKYQADKRFKIHVLANDTNNCSMVVRYGGKEYFVSFNFLDGEYEGGDDYFVGFYDGYEFLVGV